MWRGQRRLIPDCVGPGVSFFSAVGASSSGTSALILARHARKQPLCAPKYLVIPTGVRVAVSYT